MRAAVRLPGDRYMPPRLRLAERRGLIDLGAETLTVLDTGAALFGFGCGCHVTIGGVYGPGSHITGIMPGCSKGHPLAWHGLKP